MIDGKKIYFYRIKKGLTQKAACEGICSVSYLSKIENNSITASPEILQLLCERLDIQTSIVSEEVVNHLKKEIYDWYQDIKYRNADDAHRKFEELQTEVNQLNDLGLVNLFQIFSARYFMYIEDLDKAKEQLEKLTEMKKMYTTEMEFYIFQFRALYEYLTDNYKTALHFYKKAYLLASKLNILEPDLIYQIASISSRLGYFSQALYYAKTALEAFNAEANYSKGLDCHITLGIAYSRLKDFEAAKSHYLVALNAATFNPTLKAMLPNILHNMGHSYYQAEQYDEAISVLKESLRKKRGINTALTICLIAYSYYMKRQLREAKQWIRKGLKVTGEEINTPSFIRLKTMDYKLHDLEQTEEYQQFIEEKAIPYLEKIQDRLHLIEMYEELAIYYSNKFSYKHANHYYAKLNQLYKESL
ncbi:helix-turn-helix domain-containing protein [Fictibacillus terranigra]|uniref:Helix-turn-helix transcriptional regulator n=1 Tax=Fictibacillus terranigra TaxID=3058424 RepID=A0ABT8E8G7_9BACL|nr:helix-turn-helix transcriptional regulator [Fictibacillus sp. CENA-BCM004]MDN4074190.1 helix-turn-helix transcriptional regulator [Fictibacillus sp. CENA-BCM004]